MSGPPGLPLKSWRWRLLGVLAVLVVSASVAVAVVAILKSHGAGPQLQRLVAVGLIGIPLLAIAFARDIGPEDALSTAAVLIGVCAVAVAALTYIGSLDNDPARGCINTNGQIRATVSGQTTVVFSKATPAAEPTGLLLRGCEVRGVGWCVGAVHEDALESKVFDSRWLILSGNQGLVPVGHTVSKTLPEKERDDNCPGGLRPPDDIMLSDALLDRRTGAIAVVARAERAAFIGFAIRRSQERWQRLGWDYQPSDDVPVIVPGPQPPARLGDEVIAVACVGYQQAAISDDSAVAQSATLKAGQEMAPDPKRVAARQPLARDAGAAACSSAIPTPPVPYGPGTLAVRR